MISKMLGLRGASGKAEVHVGAFGKHPGWDDHMDDPGMETQRLLDFKTLVYVEGVAAAVESGRWEALDPASRLAGFDHAIVVRSRGDLIVARMWTSRDGKGRSKYPMVVAASISGARGVGTQAALRKVLPELEVAKERCEAATTADEVRGILESSRGSLRAWAESVASDGMGGGEGADIEVPAGFIAGIADRAEFGPSRRGLCRVMYQLDRDVWAMQREPERLRGRMNEAGGKGDRGLPVSALRVPIGAGGSGMTMEACVLDCLRLLLSRLEAWAPVMVTAPREGGYVDAVVGEPRGSDLFCLLAGPGAVPPTTEIPYTIDDAFHAGVDAWVDRQLSGRLVGVSTESAAKRLGVKAGRFLCVVGACAGMWGVGAGAARADAQPATSSGLEPKQQYNNALADFQLAVIDPATSDEKAEAAAKDFLARARSVPGGVAFLGEVQRTLAAVEGALDNKVGGIAAEAAKMGPAGSRVYVGKVDGALVKFAAPIAEGLPDLAFARVNLPDGSVTYIQTTEISVGEFGAILGSRSSTTELEKLAFPWFERRNDPRVGARAWEWASTGTARPGVVPARAWLSRMGLGAVVDYPAGAEPPPPAPDSPMQYVPLTMAVYTARLVGCRLPTVAEWRAARAQHAAEVKETDCNLRDRAWARQYQHAKDTIASGKRTQFPFAGSYAPGKRGEGRESVREWDDATVWFTGVNQGGGDVVHNLVGNVAEYVFEGAGVTPEARATGAEEFVASRGGDLRVIGGSALSEPGLAVDVPKAISPLDASEGYADVGFRLAFGVDVDTRSSLAARLRRILDPLPTIR